MDDWRDNPYANQRRLPDDVSKGRDKDRNTKVDVITGGGITSIGADPILTFMGPEVISKYRYPSIQQKDSE
jgi:hypothetical protein